MKLYSTNNPDLQVTLKEAVLQGQAADGGLFMPQHLPEFSAEEIKNFTSLDFNQIAAAVSLKLFENELDSEVLSKLIDQAYDFIPPSIYLDEQLSILELFHGPTLAFKDFGAKFMGQLMGYFAREDQTELTILVATSGDTGSAVASAFHKVPGINVVILYPSGKVSPLQELQLTTWGDNIHALEVQGTFDDCQKTVKQAFLDAEFKNKFNLTSANSINIARLIPQSFYYFYCQSRMDREDLTFCVPSGNFGNLCAGLIANKMGMPAKHFIAATNLNKVVPDYLQSGDFSPRTSVQTLSNAMDVGNPSNLVRIQHLFDQNFESLQDSVAAYFFDDAATIKAIQEVKNKYDYLLCPHTAVGYLAIQAHQKETRGTSPYVCLATAHPAKFKETVEDAIGEQFPLPAELERISKLEKKAGLVSTNYEEIKKAISEIL